MFDHSDEKKLKFETFLSDSLIWTDFSQPFTIDNVVEIIFEPGLTPITNNCCVLWVKVKYFLGGQALIAQEFFWTNNSNLIGFFLSFFSV